MKVINYLFILLIVSIQGPHSQAKTIYVDIEGGGDYLHIQEGIDVSSSGDTVLVADGTYYENINFIGEDIVLVSEEGPENTIIDGQQLDSVVRFESGESQRAIIKGFTITNGYCSEWPGGGGIHILDACPKSESNIIENNYGTTGGGISVLLDDYSHTPLLQIKQNEIKNNYWGGIYIESGRDIKVRIHNNEINNNSGCGIFLVCGNDNEIKKNLISKNNNADWFGGGIFTYMGAKIINNTIDSNVAGWGGGIWYNMDSESPLIKNNIITNNTAKDGGGIYEGIFPITNSIFRVEQHIYFNDVWNNSPNNYGSTLEPGPGDISENPQFIDPENLDYHLQPDSPCIDTGDPKMRDPDLSRIDMGCYFYRHSPIQREEWER
jgi:hypothetical protein